MDAGTLPWHRAAVVGSPAVLLSQHNGMAINAIVTVRAYS